LRVLAFPQNRSAAAAAWIDDGLMQVCSTNSLGHRCDVVPRECRAEDRLEFVLAGFSLQLLRSLIRFALEIIDLAAHVRELPLLLEIFQPMLFCQSGLRFRDNAIAFVVESPGDGELEVLLLAFEVPLPFSQRSEE